MTTTTTTTAAAQQQRSPAITPGLLTDYVYNGIKANLSRRIQELNQAAPRTKTVPESAFYNNIALVYEQVSEDELVREDIGNICKNFQYIITSSVPASGVSDKNRLLQLVATHLTADIINNIIGQSIAVLPSNDARMRFVLGEDARTKMKSAVNDCDSMASAYRINSNKRIQQGKPIDLFEIDDFNQNNTWYHHHLFACRSALASTCEILASHGPYEQALLNITLAASSSVVKIQKSLAAQPLYSIGSEGTVYYGTEVPAGVRAAAVTLIFPHEFNVFSLLKFGRVNGPFDNVRYIRFMVKTRYVDISNRAAEKIGQQLPPQVNGDQQSERMMYLLERPYTMTAASPDDDSQFKGGGGGSGSVYWSFLRSKLPEAIRPPRQNYQDGLLPSDAARADKTVGFPAAEYILRLFPRLFVISTPDDFVPSHVGSETSLTAARYFRVMPGVCFYQHPSPLSETDISSYASIALKWGKSRLFGSSGDPDNVLTSETHVQYMSTFRGHRKFYLALAELSAEITRCFSRVAAFVKLGNSQQQQLQGNNYKKSFCAAVEKAIETAVSKARLYNLYPSELVSDFLISCSRAMYHCESIGGELLTAEQEKTLVDIVSSRAGSVVAATEKLYDFVIRSEALSRDFTDLAEAKRMTETFAFDSGKKRKSFAESMVGVQKQQKMSLLKTKMQSLQQVDLQQQQQQQEDDPDNGGLSVGIRKDSLSRYLQDARGYTLSDNVVYHAARRLFYFLRDYISNTATAADTAHLRKVYKVLGEKTDAYFHAATGESSFMLTASDLLPSVGLMRDDNLLVLEQNQQEYLQSNAHTIITSALVTKAKKYMITSVASAPQPEFGPVSVLVKKIDKFGKQTFSGVTDKQIYDIHDAQDRELYLKAIDKIAQVKSIPIEDAAKEHVALSQEPVGEFESSSSDWKTPLSEALLVRENFVDSCVMAIIDLYEIRVN